MTKLENCRIKKVPKGPNAISPECRIKAVTCDCSFLCPACETEGKYADDHLTCPNEDCRVMRFFTQ